MTAPAAEPQRVRSGRLGAWLARSGARAKPTLEASLIAGRPWRYLWPRLRLVAAIRGLELVVHLAEFWLLVRVLGGAELAGAVVGHGAAAIAAAAWWGCLEILRAEVRARGPRWVSDAASRWLRGAAFAALAIAAATAIALAACSARGRLGPFELYLGALALRAGADAVVRAYQAGIQATRRIYRPLAAVAAAELAGLSVLAGLLPLIGSWSLPLAVLVSTALSRALALRYARRAYRLARVAPPRLLGRIPARPQTRRVPTALLWAALAGAGSRVGSMMVIALVAGAGGHLGARATALHLVTPLLALAAGACTTFYIDVVRLGDPLARRLAARFHAELLRAALAIAVVAWLAAAALLAASRAGPVLPLLPLFAAQSFFALAELELVARQRFRSAAAMAAVFAIAATVGGAVVVALAAALAVAAAAATGRATPRAASWLDELAAIGGPLAIGRVTLTGGVAPARALAALEARLASRGRVTLVGRRALWFERDGAERLDRAGVVIATAGLAVRIEVERAASGAAAAARAGRAGWLIDRVTTDAASAPDLLIDEFAALFPRGVAIDLRSLAGTRLQAPVGDLLHLVWIDALVFARGGRPRRSPYAVSALVEGGAISVLFAIPREGPGAHRSVWAARVRAASGGAALAAGRAPSHPATYPEHALAAPHG